MAVFRWMLSWIDSNSLVLFKTDIYRGDCHGYIWYWYMVTYVGNLKKVREKIVRDIMLPNELGVVAKHHELKSQLY